MNRFRWPLGIGAVGILLGLLSEQLMSMEALKVSSIVLGGAIACIVVGAIIAVVELVRR
ncbi:hypothetical protein [Levilactobacillus bambusae]|uniref:hypothetical protein n=1 Tax=Levilactobacillus bambusae TaxID=2024736 RepID=UPI001402C4D4|nr:hypothetical protein [Levilactobacillus bambusae]